MRFNMLRLCTKTTLRREINAISTFHRPDKHMYSCFNKINCHFNRISPGIWSVDVELSLVLHLCNITVCTRLTHFLFFSFFNLIFLVLHGIRIDGIDKIPSPNIYIEIISISTANSNFLCRCFFHFFWRDDGISANINYVDFMQCHKVNMKLIQSLNLNLISDY